MAGTLKVNLIGKKQKTHQTSSNYVEFNQLGKKKASYATERVFTKRGFLGRIKPIFERQDFIATGGPVAKVIKNLSTSKNNMLGKIMARSYNVTPEYMAQQIGKQPKKGDKVEVKSGADVTRTNVIRTGATGKQIVESGNAGIIGQIGSQLFSRTAHQVNKALKQKVEETTDLNQRKMYQKVRSDIKKGKERHASEALKGVSQVAGAFMTGFRNN